MRGGVLGLEKYAFVRLFKSGARRASRIVLVPQKTPGSAPGRTLPAHQPGHGDERQKPFVSRRARQFDAEGRQLELQRFGAPKQQAGQRGAADGLGHVRCRHRRAGLQRQVENPLSARSSRSRTKASAHAIWHPASFLKRLLSALEVLGMRSIEALTMLRTSLQRADGQSRSSRPARSSETAACAECRHVYHSYDPCRKTQQVRVPTWVRFAWKSTGQWNEPLKLDQRGHQI